MKKTKVYNLLLTVLVLMALSTETSALADDAHAQEQKLKAAFLYNFIKFVEWPNENNASKEKPITIGVIGSRDFIKAFEPAKHKTVKNRAIVIKYFSESPPPAKSTGSNDQHGQRRTAALMACDVLLFCRCNDGHIDRANEILRALRDAPILTVGETAGFLESGGMINFLSGDKKIGFEINNDAAKQAKLQIRSQLLRLAKRVISGKATPDAEQCDAN